MAAPAWVHSTGGARIAAYDFGGSGPPLLLAHATGFHAHAWVPVVEHLRGVFHCFAFDERGHGASPPPPDGDFDWHRFGDDARAVAAAFDLDRPLAAGHSGGAAALLLSELDEPGRWAELWLFEPVVIPPVEGTFSNPLVAPARRRKAWFPSRQAALQNYAGKPPFATFTPAALQAYVDHGFVDAPDGGVTLACRPDDEAATYGGAPVGELWRRLPEITVPAHVVGGALTTHAPGELIGDVAQRLARGTAQRMNGVGHFGPFEDPARVAASIRAAFGA